MEHVLSRVVSDAGDPSQIRDLLRVGHYPLLTVVRTYDDRLAAQTDVHSSRDVAHLVSLPLSADRGAGLLCRSIQSLTSPAIHSRSPSESHQPTGIATSRAEK